MHYDADIFAQCVTMKEIRLEEHVSKLGMFAVSSTVKTMEKKSFNTFDLSWSVLLRVPSGLDRSGMISLGLVFDDI